MSRDKREAIVILGRETVEEALANIDQAVAYSLANPKAVKEAASEIYKRRASIPDAIAYAETLAPDLRRALAASWAGDAGRRAIAALGLVEVNTDEHRRRNWGGSRPRAGRPKRENKKIPVSYTLTPELVAALDQEALDAGVSRSELLTRILSARYGHQ